MIRSIDKNYTLLILLFVTLVAGTSACSLGNASAQKPIAETARTRPAESPTPGYKPLKRVSRDVIDTDKKEEPAKNKAKK